MGNDVISRLSGHGFLFTLQGWYRLYSTISTLKALFPTVVNGGCRVRGRPLTVEISLLYWTVKKVVWGK
jgi:hypothetical protein